MTAMVGIIIALVGLGIVIVASVSFVYPLPGLTTNKRRGWIVVVGYFVLLRGSAVIQQTVPEDLREPFAGPIAFVVLGMFVLSGIALIRPLPKFWLPTRKRAGYMCGLSLGLMVVAGAFLPEPPPPTPEELAAMAAEEKREAEEAEEERRAEERKKEMQSDYEEVEARRVAIMEWGEDHQYDAEDYCADKIEELAPHLFRWTTNPIIDRRLFHGWIAIDPKKDGLSLFPEITEETLLAYAGSKIRFSDADGNFRPYQYECLYHPDSETVIRVSARPAE